MSQSKQEVLAWIDEHKEDMIAFLKEYISYRSATEHEEDVQRQFIRPFLENNMGWTGVSIVDVSDAEDRPNVNARWQTKGSGRSLLLNGHSDVVDVSDDAAEEKWDKDPWDAIIEDGKLFGRGANDMKGPNTAMIWAVKALMESNVELEGDVMVSFVVGEEFGQGRELGAAPATQALLDEGADIDLCIVGEPTNLVIQNKSAFLFDYEIEIEGKSTHASNKGILNYPQRRGLRDGREVGVDAGAVMTEIVQKFKKLEHDWNMTYRDEVWGSGGYPVAMDLEGLGVISLTNCILEAGDYIAGVPGDARIYGNVYGPPAVEPETLWEEMREAVDAVAATNSWLRDHPPEMTWRKEFDFPAIQTPLDHPGCDVLANTVTDVRDESPIFSGFKAVNDGSFIYTDCGVDVITFGPGHISMNAHGADEYIPVDQFVDACKIYALMAMEWCGYTT